MKLVKKKETKVSIDFQKGWWVGMSHAVYIIRKMSMERVVNPTWYEYVEALEKEMGVK